MVVLQHPSLTVIFSYHFINGIIIVDDDFLPIMLPKSTTPKSQITQRGHVSQSEMPKSKQKKSKKEEDEESTTTHDDDFLPMPLDLCYT
jgi:hypothetical protein